MAKLLAKHPGFNGVLPHEENLNEFSVFESDCWHRGEVFTRKVPSP
jgi:hypothetical protein